MTEGSAELIEQDRADFAIRQAEMTARWFENVKRVHGDVDAYIATRHAAYLDRWKEAARFIPNGARVLDIGGGNLFPALVEFFEERQFHYTYIDVDPSCVDGARALTDSMDLRGASFHHGYNDSLPFADNAFDAVFSSHCLEHSYDLNKTFAEVHRVLDQGGNLLMAVPFGWETNDEHPYFFGPAEWTSLVDDAGFRIRVAQIGCEYPEYGYDYFIAAQKTASHGSTRLNPGDYTKQNFTFISPFDSRLRYIGGVENKYDHVILTGEDWLLDIDVPFGTREILLIVNRQEWSGVLELTWDGVSVTEDCYSWFPYVQPIRIKSPLSHPSSIVTMRGRGQNPSSRSNQAVVFGLMVR